MRGGIVMIRGIRHGHGGPRRGRGWQPADLPSAEEIPAWFAGALPRDWFVGTPEISVDQNEILIIGELAALEDENFADVEQKAIGESGRIARFREDTRAGRINIAQAAERRFGRKVSWGARVGGTTEIFTNVSVPVMTRLRHDERKILDTLVDAGVARSRSEALAWSVRTVGEHSEAWLGELRQAMTKVDELRKRGPEAS